VLVPTRELAVQVNDETRKFTKYSWLRSVALYGAKGLRSQFRDLAHGADILVATPGLLVDALHRGVVKLDKVKYLVLDEADRMMDYGFGSQLEEITTGAGMPTAAMGRHTSFWSATIPPSVRELVEGFLGTACMWVDCTGGRTNAVPRNIEHVVIDARPRHRNLRVMEHGTPVVLQDGRKGKFDRTVVGRRGGYRVRFDDGPLTKYKVIKKGRVHLSTLHTEEIKMERMRQLKHILSSQELHKASVIVFCRSRIVAQEVWSFLSEHFAATALCHGGQSESYRRMNVARLRDGRADVLVATDLASRGLDLPDVTHVINFELPSQVDDFVHRCGRCGRIGKQGVAISFVTGREFMFNALRRTLRQNGSKLPKWFDLTGMQKAWRHRKEKLPFSKARSVMDIRSDSTPEERDAHIRRERNKFLNYQVKRMRKMEMVERGEITQKEAEEKSDDIVVRVGEDDPRYDEEVKNFL
jgi:superfamily II DNA/RNA helicase